MSNEVILARIDAEWQRFLSCLEGLSDDQAAEPGVAGYYSVDDLLAHLTWWENQTREVVESGVDQEFDVEALNDEIYQANKDATFTELKRRMIEGHTHAVETFAQAADLSEDDVAGDTWEHYQEHGDQIRAWRAARGI
ncbi:MAG: maleylpyruvate isomerase N-terminal domain-containing protein [Armatimonas sp.]